MKLSIVMLTPGPGQGRVIPINVNQFLIGRDPDCHLRPSSTHISNRHCALLRREDKVFLRDLGSTNGTFVNDQQVAASEIELHDGDRVRIAPLLFTIRLEPEPVSLPTQLLSNKLGMKNGRSSHAAIPRTEQPGTSAGSEAGAAATLLAMQERGVPETGQPIEAPDLTTLQDASFATLADKEQSHQAKDDPSIPRGAAAGITVEDGARTAAQDYAEAKQTATIQAPGLKVLKFLLGLLLGFSVTASALSAWVVSLLTVVDWFRGGSPFFTHYPSPFPLWLASFFTLAIPLLPALLMGLTRSRPDR